RVTNHCQRLAPRPFPPTPPHRGYRRTKIRPLTHHVHQQQTARRLARPTTNVLIFQNVCERPRIGPVWPPVGRRLGESKLSDGRQRTGQRGYVPVLSRRTTGLIRVGHWFSLTRWLPRGRFV